VGNAVERQIGQVLFDSGRIFRLIPHFWIIVALTGMLSGTITGFCRAQTPRPLVVVFPAGQVTSPGIGGAKDESTTAAGRTLASARALRDRLADSNALLTLVYTPESPVFALAAQQIKLDLKKVSELKPEQQLAMAKAAGAVYMVAISSPKAPPVVNQPETEGLYEMIISGREVVGKSKEYQDKILFQTAVIKAGDTDAVPTANLTPQAAQVSLDSAANTLAVRLLNGPLGAYGRPAATPQQLPVAPTKAPVEEPAAEIDQSGAALQQARSQIASNDVDGAIVTLRKAINHSPLSLSLRLALAKAYVAADRRPEAAQESRRALTLAGSDNPQERMELVRLLTDTLKQSGDIATAKQTFLQIITAQPRAVWARVGLGDTLIATGEAEKAEEQYRMALEIEPSNQDAAAGIARVHAARGDYQGALNELTATGKSGSPNARQNAVITIFNDAAPEIARLMKTNREAWEGKTLSREAFYNATQSQSKRANALLSMLRAAPPSESSGEALRKKHNQRIFAASLLAQASASLLSYLDSGDAEAGEQATIYLDDFEKEMKSLRQ
jgi:tetratricopeptide (TPR) repeat protein